MASVRIGDAEVPARVTGGLDSEVTCEFLPDTETLEFISRCVPGARAVVTIGGSEYPGQVRVTDPDDYVTVVEF